MPWNTWNAVKHRLQLARGLLRGGARFSLTDSKQAGSAVPGRHTGSECRGVSDGLPAAQAWVQTPAAHTHPLPPSHPSLQGGVGSDTSPAREGTPVIIIPPPSLIPTPGGQRRPPTLTLSSPSCPPEVAVGRGIPALEGSLPSPSAQWVLPPSRDGGRGGEEVFEGVLSGQKRIPSSHPH